MQEEEKIPYQKSIEEKQKESAVDDLPVSLEIVPEKNIPKALGYTINFSEVPIAEFIRFVSKIAQINFIYDEQLLNFNVSLVSGRPSSPEDIFNALKKILKKKGLSIVDHENYCLIKAKSKKKKEKNNDSEKETLPKKNEAIEHPPNIEKISSEILKIPQEAKIKPKGKFSVYKLKYHAGEEIIGAVKQISASSEIVSEELAKTVDSMQLVKSTNSIFFSGTEDSILEARDLIESLDTPLKQVFIEVLVIETDVKNGLEFGLEWAGGGKYKDRLGFATGNFPNNGSKLAQPFQQINASNPPSGPNQFPLGRGFDLGVIGDIILHKGRTFFSLASLVSALQQDGDTTIVLNQKLITQDNKNSQIFVGDNIPFTGSVVQTVGSSQQTTSNIEYRDIGVSLNIKPLLGENEIITLEISEEISEATNDPINANNVVNGIQTTKTNMLTSVHVPDQNFLVLSGMIRNTKTKRKSGIPCLGGLPLIGAAFSKNTTQTEKRNIIIFVRPQIINSFDQYQDITAGQEKIYKFQSDPKAFQEGIDLVDGPN
ncbi:MAG: hypothetical protein Tsb0015_11580 [Simkaniaceae bacterium]